MTRIEKLRSEVDKLYKAKNPNRDEWADWLYENHVVVVADYAVKLANRFNVDTDLSEAAAILHDIADTSTGRFNLEHEEQSLKIARKLMQYCGYSRKEIAIVVDDACKLHSCKKGDPLPQTDAGKILATADALAHVDDDKFYKFFREQFIKRGELSNKTREKSLAKLNRDYHRKIMFPQIKKEQKENYEKLKLFITS